VSDKVPSISRFMNLVTLPSVRFSSKIIGNPYPSPRKTPVPFESKWHPEIESNCAVPFTKYLPHLQLPSRSTAYAKACLDEFGT